MTPDNAGRFEARVPAGRKYVVEVHAFGRKVADRQLDVVNEDVDLGAFAEPSHTRLTVNVSEMDTFAPLTAEVFLVPVDATTLQDTQGSLHGAFTPCAPWLGPPRVPRPRATASSSSMASPRWRSPRAASTSMPSRAPSGRSPGRP
ncbi:hypothetical protein ACN28S_34810 [Cystobacter fuscus]